MSVRSPWTAWDWEKKIVLIEAIVGLVSSFFYFFNLRCAYSNSDRVYDIKIFFSFRFINCCERHKERSVLQDQSLFSKAGFQVFQSGVLSARPLPRDGLNHSMDITPISLTFGCLKVTPTKRPTIFILNFEKHDFEILKKTSFVLQRCRPLFFKFSRKTYRFPSLTWPCLREMVTVTKFYQVSTTIF